jgi:hypothetical protein
MYFSFLQSLLEQGDLENDEEFRRKIEAVSSDVGVKLAEQVRSTFKLGDSIIDAVDAWKIGCVAAGFKFRVEKEGERYTFHHLICPMHKFFTKRGIVPCKTLCLPTVAAIARTICPDCDVEIIREGDLETTCIKAIKPKAFASPDKGVDS